MSHRCAVGAIAAAMLAAWPAATLAGPGAEPVAERLGYAIAVPEGWSFDVERSNAVSRGLQAERHYDGLRTNVGADAYVGDRASLFVQWVHARDEVEGSARLELTMRRTFDQIRGAAAAGELVRWREDVRRDLAEGNLEWSDAAGGTVTLVRAFVFVTDDDLLRQVRAECVYSGRQPADRDRCQAALASLELTEATGARGSIGAVPGAGTLRLSTDGDAPAEIAVKPGTPAAHGDAAKTVQASEGGEATAVATGDASGDRLVLEAPTLDRAATPGSASGPPRVLYQAPAGSEGSPARPTDRTNQLVTLIGAVLVAAAVYAIWRERRRKADDPTAGDDSPGDRDASDPDRQT